MAAYRAHVDAAVDRLIETANAAALPEIVRIVELGLNHEQQHQELILTDILHAFAQNPTSPTYDRQWRAPAAQAGGDGFVAIDGGIYTLGDDTDGFVFDNERPAHQVLLQPVRIARRLVTNGEWLAFMKDGGYENPALWLSDGWSDGRTRRGGPRPCYWRETDGRVAPDDARRACVRSIRTRRSAT